MRSTKLAGEPALVVVRSEDGTVLAERKMSLKRAWKGARRFNLHAAENDLRSVASIIPFPVENRREA
jgi:hypothetical protein